MEISNYNVCRLCLVQNVAMESIFKEDSSSFKIPYKIFTCINLQFTEDDGYPNTICTKCNFKINDFFKFKLDCINSDSVLRKNSVDTSQCDQVDATKKTEKLICSAPKEISCTVMKPLELSNNNIITKNKQRSRKYTKYKERQKPSNPLTTDRKKTKKENKQLRQRVKVSTSLKKDQCNTCGKIFKSLGYLSSHMRIHNGHKPFHCKICKKKFSQKSSLIVHLRKHSGDKPYVCRLCGKGFSQSSNLSVHQRSHTGERPFHCDICSKSFTQIGNLYIHKRIHSGERRYRCGSCGMAFKFPSHLAEHERIHSNHKRHHCSVCNKGFHKGSYLSTHMRIHTGEKPYGCEHCGKSFSNSSNLAAHIRIHTGSKPYVCNICNKGFAQSSALVRHTKQHKLPAQNNVENSHSINQDAKVELIENVLKNEILDDVYTESIQDEQHTPREQFVMNETELHPIIEPPVEEDNSHNTVKKKKKIIIHSIQSHNLPCLHSRRTLLNNLHQYKQQNRNSFITKGGTDSITIAPNPDGTIVFKRADNPGVITFTEEPKYKMFQVQTVDGSRQSILCNTSSNLVRLEYKPVSFPVVADIKSPVKFGNVASTSAEPSTTCEELPSAEHVNVIDDSYSD